MNVQLRIQFNPKLKSFRICLINFTLILTKIIVKKIPSSKMIVIETIRQQFGIIGIGDYNPSNRMYPFNERNLLVLLLFFLNLIINGVYFCNGADSFDEYVNSVFTCSTIIVAATAFGIIIWKMKQIFKFFKNLKKIIKKRECLILVSNRDC